MKLGSLFDGIGGFPLSAIQHGIEPVWASEIEPFPILVTKKHFPNMKHLGDITKINGAEIEPVEIITGGSPCQDLSVAGKRAGLAGERSGLFMEQIRIIKEMREHDRATGRSAESIRPRFMVWENVPGAFSSNGGEDFRVVLEETARIADETVTIPRPRDGKWNTAGAIMGRNFSIAWRVLDAQYWGVPQRRRRIFLVADFGGHSAGEILFKSESMSRDTAESRKAREEVAAGVGTGTDNTSHGLASYNQTASEEIINPIRSVNGGDTKPIALVAGTVSAKWAKGTGGPAGDECQNLVVLNDQIQGSMIGGADKNSPQGDGINEDVSFTLNTTDRHAVAYGICPDASNSMKSENPHSGIYEADTARTLDQNGGNPACNQGGMAVVQTEQTAFTPTQFGQYAEGCGTLRANGGDNGGGSENLITNQYTVRRLTPTECERLQGFPDDWTNIPGTKKVSKEELEFWRDVWYEWDKMQSEKPEEVSPRTDKAILRWLKNPTSDTARYKALGNSVAIPCVTWIMRQIANELRRNAEEG